MGRFKKRPHPPPPLIVIHVRQELKNEDEIDKFLQSISKMKTCKGFPEKDVKPGKFVK